MWRAPMFARCADTHLSIFRVRVKHHHVCCHTLQPSPQIYHKMAGALAMHDHLMTERETLERTLNLEAATPPLQINTGWATAPSNDGLQLQQRSRLNYRLWQQPFHQKPLPGDGSAVVLDDAALGRTLGAGLQHAVPISQIDARITTSATADPCDATKPLKSGDTSWLDLVQQQERASLASAQERERHLDAIAGFLQPYGVDKVRIPLGLRGIQAIV